jgi:acetyl-CoA acyltransferase 1
MQRVEKLAQQVTASPALANLVSGGKSPDDVVICCAVRTALCKAKRGGFNKLCPEEMLAPLFQAIIEKTKVDPAKVGDIQIGNVLQPGAGAISARQAMLMGGFPESVSLMTLDRQCSSGLQAVANVAGQIKAGFIDVGIAGGVESMSMFDMASGVDPDKIGPTVFDHEGAMKCLIPMGTTSENVAAKFGVSKEKQDQMAVGSHAKAVAAKKNGWFKDEIVPVKGRQEDKEGNVKEVMITDDEGMREGMDMAALAKLKPAFGKNPGTTTAGNCSQMTDGAALILVAKRSAAEALGLPILAKMRSFSVAGCPPEIMGIGPAVAIPMALKQAGLTVNDIDVFEVNEAFASQAVYCVETLGIPMEKLNPKGGAIALGHPLGATGARQIATLLPELKRQGKKMGVVSMCIGTGMGAAGVFESEQ